MRFNNFLNRLRIRRIYALIVVLAIAAVAFVIIGVRALLHVPSPDSVFRAYLNELKDGHYNEAVRLLVPEKRKEWTERFAEMVKDESAESSLKVMLHSLVSCELVSQSSLADDGSTLRYQLTAADAKAMLSKVRQDAESGAIDMSDPDVVRVSKDPQSTLLYYVEDNFKHFEQMLVHEQIVVNFKLEGNLFTRRWYIEPEQSWQNLLSGNLDEAVKEVFRAPLNLPKQ